MPSNKYSHTLHPCASAPHVFRASESHTCSRYVFYCMLYMNIFTPYIFSPYTFSHPIPTPYTPVQPVVPTPPPIYLPPTLHRPPPRRHRFARAPRLLRTRRAQAVLQCVVVCCSVLQVAVVCRALALPRLRGRRAQTAATQRTGSRFVQAPSPAPCDWI